MNRQDKFCQYVLLKIEPHFDKIFISKDAIRVYFKPFALEERHTPRQ